MAGKSPRGWESKRGGVAGEEVEGFGLPAILDVDAAVGKAVDEVGLKDLGCLFFGIPGGRRLREEGDVKGEARGGGGGIETKEERRASLFCLVSIQVDHDEWRFGGA